LGNFQTVIPAQYFGVAKIFEPDVFLCRSELPQKKSGNIGCLYIRLMGLFLLPALCMTVF
jgi:hypothetical protein